ncbi:MAG: ABC transporter [Phycisphaerae bacterium]|nr:ABC transporter [Phycisphaerae bacterium]
MNRPIVAVASLLLLLAAFFAFNIFAGTALRTARVDLTENRVYTLAPGSATIARLPDEPVKLTFFYTADLGQGLPQVQTYARRVREMLDEFVRLSKGKVGLEVVNPEPYSETEDRAVEAGLRGIPLRAGETLYLGLVGVNATGGREVIPFFDSAQESLLEYDLARLVYALASPKKTVVGLLSTLPIEGMMIDPMTGTALPQQRRIPPWAFVQEMRSLYDVRTVEPRAGSIPGEIDVLVLVHPRGLGARTLFAIDQFVLRGGKLLAFADPLCESDIPPDAQRNPMTLLTAERSSWPGALADAWGLSMATDKVAGDVERSVRVASGAERNPEPVSFPAWMELNETNLSASDPITARLKRVIVASAGAIDVKPDAPLAATPILTTSPRAGFIEAVNLRFMPDPRKVLAEFVPGDKALTLGVRLSGTARSAFPGGRPPREPDPMNPDPPPDEPETGEPIREGRVEAIVIADADLLADRFWTQEQRLFGAVSLGFTRVADNGDLVINAIDNLTGSSDLMSIRARTTFSRPFTKVQEIQRAAEKKFLDEQKALEDKINASNDRLAQLQRAKPDDPTTQLILSPEQRAEIERLNRELLEARKQLRQVQHSLRKDVEGLERRVKLINIGAVPAAVAVGAIALGAVRSTRRCRTRRD